ncbi:MAG TPA: sigma factor-like helix-turn-helix DNA-binding protein [Terriglobales bacterium]|nr:sigma factor-like helix-turn-helix DNA-binding protein [Terriglobales bacterium]
MKKKKSVNEEADIPIKEDQPKDKRKKDHFVDYYTCSLGYGRKKGKRIRTLNWIEGVEEPESLSEEADSEEKMKEEKAKVELEEKVEAALDKLEAAEKEFVRYFYYDCKSYDQISEIMHKTKDRLERIHKSALEKLQFQLKGFVFQRYKIKIPLEKKCIICSHPYKEKLEELIKAKKKEETWKKTLRIFKEKFNLEIKAPQILINHQKKHMLDQEH